jgi:hypothetical protein
VSYNELSVDDAFALEDTGAALEGRGADVGAAAEVLAAVTGGAVLAQPPRATTSMTTSRLGRMRRFSPRRQLSVSRRGQPRHIILTGRTTAVIVSSTG